MADLSALRAPFKQEEIGLLPKVTCRKCSARDVECDQHRPRKCRECGAKISPEHIHIEYVGHAHVTDRLLSVDPEWSWEPVGFSGNGLPAMDDIGGMWIRLTVAGVTRLGYGHAGQKRGGDAVKEVIGDAIRNAAMRFGVALDLWKKEAPEPVAETAAQEQPTMTVDDRRKQLRGQIAVVGKAKGMQIADLEVDFATWSRGPDLPDGAQISKTSSVKLLQEYLQHLQGGAA